MLRFCLLNLKRRLNHCKSIKAAQIPRFLSLNLMRHFNLRRLNQSSSPLTLTRCLRSIFKAYWIFSRASWIFSWVTSALAEPLS